MSKKLYILLKTLIIDFTVFYLILLGTILVLYHKHVIETKSNCFTYSYSKKVSSTTHAPGPPSTETYLTTHVPGPPSTETYLTTHDPGSSDSNLCNYLLL